MVWKVNKIGKEQIWYSKEEYEIIKQRLLNCLKFINDVRINVCLDDIELHNLDCKNCEDKIKRFYKLYEEYFKKDFDIYSEMKKLKGDN